MSTIYDDAKAAGLPMDNHESDLYLMDSPEARALLAKYPDRSKGRFRSQVDGRVWWDIPFAFLPWWRKRGAA